MDTDLLIKWRRDLHQIPEVGYHEEQTTAYLKNELEEMGYKPINVDKTGLYVYLDFNKEKTIAFRTDIDALKIKEETGVPFCSKNLGYMHACGHDGHMTAMLGFAKKLKERDDYPHNILLIFQPAEEVVGGANSVINLGIFEKYNVRAIFGLHLFPDLPEGIIGCRKGPLMAESGELDIEITGKAAHAGLPQDGVDSIMIASLILQQCHNIIARTISPFESALINIGVIEGGSARNIVAKNTVLKGTIRAYDEEIFNGVVNKLKSFARGLEETYDCKITINCEIQNPPVLNHSLLYKKFKEIAKYYNYQELELPVMLSEDYAHYQKVLPGIFFFLGTRTSKYITGLHTPTFNFNEHVLENGINLYFDLATKISLEDL